ncbi:uncharacterized protein G2W53_027165 [Senna tora]|uniref:Uncharacterized protein n=1 Tax=Senna tora TaxID=362788 RepID=A0A834TIU3_9FABA|nr:uncharacterized protein G2W53_027165 [Senna tora]
MRPLHDDLDRGRCKDGEGFSNSSKVLAANGAGHASKFHRLVHGFARSFPFDLGNFASSSPSRDKATWHRNKGKEKDVNFVREKEGKPRSMTPKAMSEPPPMPEMAKGLYKMSLVRSLTLPIDTPNLASPSHPRTTNVVDLDSSRDSIMDKRDELASKCAHTDRNSEAPSQTSLSGHTRGGASVFFFAHGRRFPVDLMEKDAMGREMSAADLSLRGSDRIVQGLGDLHDYESLWKVCLRLESLKQYYEEEGFGPSSARIGHSLGGCCEVSAGIGLFASASGGSGYEFDGR